MLKLILDCHPALTKAVPCLLSIYYKNEFPSTYMGIMACVIDGWLVKSLVIPLCGLQMLCSCVMVKLAFFAADGQANFLDLDTKIAKNAPKTWRTSHMVSFPLKYKIYYQCRSKLVVDNFG